MNSSIQQLKEIVYKGASDKNLAITDIVLDRINFELLVIESLGFPDYFITYSRIIEMCNELNLLRSYGRGSAASSLVNYCLDITKINPLAGNFIFERFINSQQKNLPDIDIDIDIDIVKGNQKKVVEKLKQKYPDYYTYFIAFSPQKDTDYQDVVCNDVTCKKHPCGIIITTEKITNSVFLYEEQEYYFVTDILNDPLYKSKSDIFEIV
ncbi:MAG: hypothetical protein CVU00_02665 [Bacteroidetes bacterium HGW-Bacteroidetes-17]|jgi:DNA polymerase III alpha subunit|nr:MAG: hypothetical protein CVU00_02665 [Bacteroidetes bacterium HGW-Bacteroidetes-17]